MQTFGFDDVFMSLKRIAFEDKLLKQDLIFNLFEDGKSSNEIHINNHKGDKNHWRLYGNPIYDTNCECSHDLIVDF